MKRSLLVRVFIHRHNSDIIDLTSFANVMFTILKLLINTIAAKIRFNIEADGFTVYNTTYLDVFDSERKHVHCCLFSAV